MYMIYFRKIANTIRLGMLVKNYEVFNEFMNSSKNTGIGL